MEADKKHYAILAKNKLARMAKSRNYSHIQVIAHLKEIENYIGEGNQPSVYDILNSEQNI